jgi:hypothetical protein
MKTILFLFSFFLLMSCQKSNWLDFPDYSKNDVVVDTSYISEQEALGYWLLSQPEQVRLDFKRDFTFSGQEIKALVDSLKIHDSIIHY